MKKLLLRIILLALPFLVLVHVVGLYYAKGFHSQYIVKKRLLESAANQVQTLTVGSSHTYYGILPKFMDYGTFNLAHVSQSIYYDVELVQEFLPRLPHGCPVKGLSEICK